MTVGQMKTARTAVAGCVCCGGRCVVRRQRGQQAALGNVLDLALLALSVAPEPCHGAAEERERFSLANRSGSRGGGDVFIWKGGPAAEGTSEGCAWCVEAYRAGGALKEAEPATFNGFEELRHEAFLNFIRLKGEGKRAGWLQRSVVRRVVRCRQRRLVVGGEGGGEGER